jgi:hypothetical protein
MQFQSIFGRSDSVSVSLALWKAASVILTLVTSVFCGLTAIIAAQNAKCAGQTFLLGFRSGTLDFLAPAIFSALAALIFGIRLTSEKIRAHNTRYNWEVFRFGPIYVTFGVLVFYWTLLVGVGIFGMLTWISIMRYKAITGYCLSKLAFILMG